MPPSPFRTGRLVVVLGALLAWPVRASAVDVTNAWARSTVKGQTASVAYMTITSATAGRIVGATSPVAAVVQVHGMSMEGTTMRMRAVEAVELPAGQAVELKPGGLHVMLMDVRQPLASGDKLPLVLRIEGPDHRIVEQAVSIDVRDAPPLMQSR